MNMEFPHQWEVNKEKSVGKDDGSRLAGGTIDRGLSIVKAAVT